MGVGELISQTRDPSCHRFRFRNAADFDFAGPKSAKNPFSHLVCEIKNIRSPTKNFGKVKSAKNPFSHLVCEIKNIRSPTKKTRKSRKCEKSFFASGLRKKRHTGQHPVEACEKKRHTGQHPGGGCEINAADFAFAGPKSSKIPFFAFGVRNKKHTA